MNEPNANAEPIKSGCLWLSAGLIALVLIVGLGYGVLVSLLRDPGLGLAVAIVLTLAALITVVITARILFKKKK